MKKKILFVNDEMVVGGVSRVLNNLLSKLDSDQLDITLLVLHKHGELLSNIPSFVKVIEGTSFFEVCDMPIKECINSGISMAIRKMYFYFLLKTGLITSRIKKERIKMSMPIYDVEIAFKEGFCSLFVAAGSAKKKINWIHADYKIKNYASNYMGTMIKELKKFDHHIAVSKVAAQSFKEVFNLNEVQVIHNVIKDDEILSKSLEEINYRDEKFSFISVGRLHPQKAYDRLIKVCNQLVKEGYDFNLYLIGDGEMLEALNTLIKEFKLINIFLLGNQSNPFKYLRQADCFVLSSIYEGLPTVVYEAFILKVPVIATRVAGVDEQIDDSIGMIVENSDEGLYLGMKEILTNPEKIVQMKNNLSNYAYQNEEIIKEVNQLFESDC